MVGASCLQACGSSHVCADVDSVHMIVCTVKLSTGGLRENEDSGGGWLRRPRARRECAEWLRAEMDALTSPIFCTGGATSCSPFTYCETPRCASPHAREREGRRKSDRKCLTCNCNTSHSLHAL